MNDVLAIYYGGAVGFAVLTLGALVVLFASRRRGS